MKMRRRTPRRTPYILLQLHLQYNTLALRPIAFTSGLGWFVPGLQGYGAPMSRTSAVSSLGSVLRLAIRDTPAMGWLAATNSLP